MIPIQDQRGRVIAFGGRILDKGEPKYLNSPDTPLFDKGRTLFNIERAGGRLPQGEPAGSGRRLYGRHRAGEGRYRRGRGGERHRDDRDTARTHVADGRGYRSCASTATKAGQKAAIRAAQRALPLIAPGRTLRFALLPSGQDPGRSGEERRRGGDRGGVRNRRSALDELLWRSEYEAQPLSTPEAKAGLRKRLNELTGAYPGPRRA